MIFYLLLVLCINGIFSKESAPTVQINQGGIKGYYKQSYNGRKYAAYEGIPYALPPVGTRRFQPPSPMQNWVGNLSATKLSNACIQFAHAPDSIDRVDGDEDCLYLNIYVPVENNVERMAVLFMIHGGGFQMGRASPGATFLMDKDVILVTVNYRLGIFGFLSTEDDHVLGNMGLKDQSLALQWVSENIKYFNGDPKKITLMGQSAGGSSVQYHYLSSWSKGLFQNGISFSGGTLGPGKQTENSREKAYKLAAIVGCPTNDIFYMIECLRKRPARSIAEATKHFMPFHYNPFTPFGPVVEKTGDKPFINRSPVEIINSGNIADVLWLTGIVSEEGLYPAAEFVNNDEYLEDLNKNWESIAPHLLDYNFTIPINKHAEVARKIRNHYFGEKPINRKTIKSLISLIGDRLYVVDGEKAARLQAKVNKSPVLFWYYSYRALTSGSDTLSKSMDNYGVDHGDDVLMILENDEIYPPILPKDREMQLKLINMVVSVANKGYPDLGLNFNWKKVDPTEEELDFLHIAHPDYITMSSNDNLGDRRFWSTIDFNENKLPNAS